MSPLKSIGTYQLTQTPQFMIQTAAGMLMRCWPMKCPVQQDSSWTKQIYSSLCYHKGERECVCIQMCVKACVCVCVCSYYMRMWVAFLLGEKILCADLSKATQAGSNSSCQSVIIFLKE